MPKIGRVRIADVAGEAGVSIATVDRVLNNRLGVRPATSERVWSAIARLNLDRHNGMPVAGLSADAAIDFVLPSGAGPSIDTSLASAIERSGRALDIETRCHSFERFNPAELNDQLRLALDAGSNGVAFMALEHPLVRSAVDQITAAGVRTVAILSDLSGSRRSAFVGIDNRAAGRTAGYLMGRFLGRRAGKVAVLAGSHLYRSHDEREIGFRGVCRESFPKLEVLDLVVGNDDPEANYQKIRAQLSENDDLVGIYSIGSGNRGVVKALRECGREYDVVFIVHHLTPVSREFLLEGAIDAVIHQDMEQLATAVMGLILAGRDERISETKVLPFEIVVRENVFH